jgi:hypothetical protein
VEDRREDLRDRVRFWAEECDTLRGFQLSADDLGGFGGLAAAAVEELRDEYASTPIAIFSLRPPVPQGSAKLDARVRLLNDALATSLLAPNADLYAPIAGVGVVATAQGKNLLTGSGFRFNPASRYHCSAVAAACMDTASLPWRVNGSAGAGASGRILKTQHYVS